MISGLSTERLKAASAVGVAVHGVVDDEVEAAIMGNDFGGDANGYGAILKVFGDDGVGTNRDIIADFEQADDLGTGADKHTVAEFRPSTLAAASGDADGDLVGEVAVIPDEAGTDEDRAEMVEVQAASDAGLRRYRDAGVHFDEALADDIEGA